jgi:hypothetical protein
MYGVMTGTEFFGEFSPDATGTAVCSGKRPGLPWSVPSRYRRLIADCWHRNAAERPAMKSVVEGLARAALADTDVNLKKFRDYQDDIGGDFQVPKKRVDAKWIGWVGGFLLFFINLLFFFLKPPGGEAIYNEI